jgi:hypothetical protein
VEEAATATKRDRKGTGKDATQAAPLVSYNVFFREGGEARTESERVQLISQLIPDDDLFSFAHLKDAKVGLTAFLFYFVSYIF